MEAEQAKQIWAELVAEARSVAGERRPGEVTIDEFSTEAGVPRQCARAFLELRVRQGILKKRKMYLVSLGSTANLYSPVE